ncbi:MAG: type IX secretion system membrane protein PorP/SprF [Bacteroidota bacterium]
MKIDDRMKRLGILFLLLVAFLNANAQDPQFSQYYASPLYLNPSFVGTTPYHRFIFNHRNQWPSIANGFVTYAFSYDYNLVDQNSGVGLLVTTDKAGSADLRSTTINLLYAYKLQLADKWVISPSIYFGYGSRNIDFNKLVFGDQLEFDLDGNIPTDDPSFGSLGNAGFFDFGAGILIYNKHFWGGISSYHLNQPNQSLLDGDSRLPVRTSVHAGAQIPIKTGPFSSNRNISVAPSFVYKRQGNFDQLDLGLRFLLQPVMIGFWYRGIPIQQNVNDNISQDAFVLILGMQFEQMEVGYSYDFTISELGPISGGAHEISLKYEVDLMLRRKVKRKQKYIPCPTFIKKN